MLDRLDEEARSAVSAASDEAQRLGHPHVGTEHLLLGLVAQTGTPASDALIAAGASLVSVREKVVEALASRSTNSPSPAGKDLPFTERASRALDRAGRMSLRLGRDRVRCEHILLSVLDVEGTAGQVLRGLWVDPEAVRRALTSDATTPRAVPTPQPEPESRPRVPGPLCGTCGSPLTSSLERMTVPVGAISEIGVIYCTVCGTALGVDPT